MDRLHELSSLLIDLKSEYDNLTRETLFRRTDAEKIGV